MLLKMPADFSLELFTPSQLASFWNLSRPTTNDDAVMSTRRQFARIRAKSKGILTPRSQSRGPQASEPGIVKFHLILERLHFGFLPETLIPTICLLLVVLPLASFLVPFVHARFAKVAEKARLELAQGEKKLQ